jgi:DNA ligase-4
MLVYYDVLLLDEQSLLDVRHSERFKILTSLVERRKGWAELVPREIIDFGHSLAASNLRKVFARTIVNKQEGLVLKPDEPYFDFSVPGRPWSGRCIKLKKEYIGNFGDVGDFAAVGAGYDAVKAKYYNIPDLRWTHFYIGCLNNREEVRRWSAKPEFTVVNVVELNETQLKSVTQFGNPRPVQRDRNEDIDLKIAPGIELNPRLSVVFTSPMVFDMRCFSFERGGTTGFWSLRFPMVSKVHFDRDFKDTFSFEQLQNMAKEATRVPELPDSQENLHWIARLEGADPRGIAVDAVSQLTATTMPTPSPCRSTPSASQGLVQSPLACRKSVIPTSPQTYAGPSRDLRREFGLPALPLITPPTSSEPTAQSPERGLHNRGLKRDSRSSSKASQSRNKRKSAEKCQTSSSPLQQMNRSHLRKPLGQIDANSSQRSRHSLPADAEPAKATEPAAEPEVIDLTSSADEPSLTTVSKMNSLQAADASSQESEEVTVFLLDDGRHHEAHRTPLPSDENARPPRAEERVSEFSSGHKRTGCIHAGSQCQFAKMTVLLAPHLAEPPPRMSTLLDTHGIKSGTSDIKAWMADLGPKVEPNAMLLVDSVEHPGATKALLEMIADQRKTLPPERHDEEAITVYDWRVLEYITILEDESITRKYYDGFRDPWRRWYCGWV